MHFYCITGPVLLLLHCLNQLRLFFYGVIIYFQYRPEQILTPQEFQRKGHIQVANFDISHILCLLSGLAPYHPLNFLRRKPLFYFGYQHADLYGLGNEIIHPLPAKHFLCSFDGIGCQGNNRHIIILRMKTPDYMRGFHSVQFRHHMVHKHNIIMAFGNLIHSRLAAERRVNLHFQRLQQPLGHSKVDSIIIHNQYFRFRRHKFKGLIHLIVIVLHRFSI